MLFDQIAQMGRGWKQGGGIPGGLPSGGLTEQMLRQWKLGGGLPGAPQAAPEQPAAPAPQQGGLFGNMQSMFGGQTPVDVSKLLSMFGMPIG